MCNYNNCTINCTTTSPAPQTRPDTSRPSVAASSSALPCRSVLPLPSPDHDRMRRLLLPLPPQRQGLLLRLCLLCSSETHVLEALIQAQMKAVEGSKRIQRFPVNGRYLLNRIPLRQKRTTSSANVSAWGFFCCSTANPRPWSATSQRWTLHSG